MWVCRQCDNVRNSYMDLRHTDSPTSACPLNRLMCIRTQELYFRPAFEGKGAWSIHIAPVRSGTTADKNAIVAF
jgi:hypothetical protein